MTTCYRQSDGKLSASRSNWERSRQASARTGGVHCLSTRTQPRGHDPRVQPLLLRGKRRDVAAIDHALSRRAHLLRVRVRVRVGVGIRAGVRAKAGVVVGARSCFGPSHAPSRAADAASGRAPALLGLGVAQQQLARGRGLVRVRVRVKVEW